MLTSASLRACRSSVPSPLHEEIHSNGQSVPLQGVRLGDQLTLTPHYISQHILISRILFCLKRIVLYRRNCCALAMKWEASLPTSPHNNRRTGSSGNCIFQYNKLFVSYFFDWWIKGYSEKCSQDMYWAIVLFQLWKQKDRKKLFYHSKEHPHWITSRFSYIKWNNKYLERPLPIQHFCLDMVAETIL